MGLTAGLAVVLLAAFASPTDQPRELYGGVIQEPPTLSDLVASCSGIVDWPRADASGWLPTGAPHAYTGFPPTSGTFAAEPLPTRFFSVAGTPDADVNEVIPRAMANLWRGQMVVWYQPAIDPDTLEGLRTTLERDTPSGTWVALPWPQDLMSRWNSRRPIVLSGWGLSQSCAVASPDVFRAFGERITADGAPGVGTPEEEAGPQQERVFPVMQ